MLVKKQPYNPIMPKEYLDNMRRREVRNIQKRIIRLNIQEQEIHFATALLIAISTWVIYNLIVSRQWEWLVIQHLPIMKVLFSRMV